MADPHAQFDAAAVDKVAKAILSIRAHFISRTINSFR